MAVRVGINGFGRIGRLIYRTVRVADLVAYVARDFHTSMAQRPPDGASAHA
jgi:glyceraldehyde-3-phosphate dehydrogenase/erythrose-4-phosphate dehydrogenase